MAIHNEYYLKIAVMDEIEIGLSSIFLFVMIWIIYMISLFMIYMYWFYQRSYIIIGNRWEAVVSYIHSLIVIPEPHLLNYWYWSDRNHWNLSLIDFHLRYLSAYLLMESIQEWYQYIPSGVNSATQVSCLMRLYYVINHTYNVIQLKTKSFVNNIISLLNCQNYL